MRARLAAELTTVEERIAAARWVDLARLVAALTAIGVLTALAGVYQLGFLVVVMPLAVMAARSTRVACVLVAMTSPLVSIGAVSVGFHLLPGYVLIASGLAGALLRREWRGIRPHWLDGLLLGFAGTATIVSISDLGTAPASTVVGASGANSAELRSPAQLAALLLMFGLYGLIRMGVRDRDTLRAAVRALLVSFLFVAAFGLYQALARVTGLPYAYVNDRRTLADLPIHGNSYVRINSTLPEASPLAAFALAAFAVSAAALLVADRRFATRRAAVGLMGVALVILALTLSKAAVVAALVTLPLLLPLRRQAPSRRQSRLAIALVLGLLVVLVAGGLAFRYGDTLSHPGYIARSESYVRVGYWEASLKMASAHPLGVGVGNYTFYYPRYAPLSLKYEFYPGVADGHSWYFEALAETGFLGAAFLVLFAFSLPFVALRHRERDGEDQHLVRALVVSWLAVALMHLSYSYFYYPFEWVLAALLAGAISLRRPAPAGLAQR